MANVNDGLRRTFKNGGVMQIGATPDTVLNVKAGTLRWVPGLNQEMPRREAGSLLAPQVGDEQPTELEFELYLVAFSGATEVYTVLKATNTGTSGVMNTVSLAFKFPDYVGAATGDTVTFGSCYLPSRGLEFLTVAEGQDFDYIRARMMHNDADASYAAYP